ncbi:MAG TPA: hypothetical protein VGI10_07790 [Polyangiaceae bacterium]|jgi:hypothetical protein
MAVVLACLKDGKMWVVSEGRQAWELESPYAEQARKREAQTPTRQTPTQQLSAQVVGLSRGRVGSELMYAITVGAMSEIFAANPEVPGTASAGAGTASAGGAAVSAARALDEQRIFHAADARISDVALSLEDEAIACTVEGQGGSSAIGILADDGRGVRTVTEGDVVDRAPRWVPGGKRRLVYASAGIGRTAKGVYGGLAPFGVHRLSLNDGSVEVIAIDGKFDYLAPIAASDSEIYAIRRPYREPRAPALGRALLDKLLQPLRLAAREQAVGAERMLVWGNWVAVCEDADHANHDEQNLARTYELVRITPKGITSLLQSVLAFDVAPDGTLYYSSGSAVFRLEGSRARKLSEIERVEQLVAMSAVADANVL